MFREEDPLLSVPPDAGVMTMKGEKGEADGEEKHTPSAGRDLASGRMDPDLRTVVILERQTDAAWFLDRHGGSAGNLQIVSAGPAASWELERRGIPFTPIEVYAGIQGLVDLGMENFRRVDALCLGLDTFIGSRYDPISGYRPTPARDTYFFAKILVDGLTLRISYLSGIVEQLKPAVVVTAGCRIPRGPAGRLPFHPGESIFGRILAGGPWTCRAEHLVTTDAVGTPEQEPGGVQAALRDTVAGIPGLQDTLSLARMGKWRDAATVGASAVRNRVSGGALLVLHGYGYSWNEILPDLYRAGYRIIHTHPRVGKPADGGPLPLPESLFRPHCSYRGVDFTAIVRERYLPVLDRCVQSMRETAGQADRVLRSRKVAAVLCSTKTGCEDHVVAATARNQGIPVLSWQHGAQGINEAPIMPYVEMAGSDLHLCYGEGVRRTFLAAEEPFGCRLLPVGSAELDRIASRPDRGNPRFRVLYATTNYYENNLYVSSPSILQDNELFRSQKAILTVLGESGVKTAFKLHPGSSRDALLQELVRSRGYDHITIFRRQEPFRDLLADAGAVVLDFPSTTLLQALAAGKPVFVLTRHLALTPEAYALLQRCAWCTDNLDQFTGLLRDFLGGRLPLPDHRDRMFLECYGTGPAGGQVAERAIGILGEAIRKAGQ